MSGFLDMLGKALDATVAATDVDLIRAACSLDGTAECVCKPCEARRKYKRWIMEGEYASPNIMERRKREAEARKQETTHIAEPRSSAQPSSTQSRFAQAASKEVEVLCGHCGRPDHEGDCERAPGKTNVTPL